MAAHVGLDPTRDIEWVTSPKGGRALWTCSSPERVDAFLGFPPEPQEIRARGFSRVIVNTITDKPWSDYFCCMIYGNRAWVRDHPVASKRFLRAIYKAADFCTAEPASAARQGSSIAAFVERYDYALETIEGGSLRPLARVRFSKTPCGSTRFACTRSGMIKSSPNALLAEGTDWRFLNELKRELKA